MSDLQMTQCNEYGKSSGKTSNTIMKKQYIKRTVCTKNHLKITVREHIIKRKSLKLRPYINVFEN